MMQERGATLIELLVTMVIFGITFTGAMNGLNQINWTNQRAKSSIFAEQALNQAVHELLNLPGNSPRLADNGGLSDLWNVVTPTHTTGADGQPWVISLDGRNFRVFYNVAPGSIPNTIDLMVFTAWNTDGGPPDYLHRVERHIARGIF